MNTRNKASRNKGERK